MKYIIVVEVHIRMIINAERIFNLEFTDYNQLEKSHIN